MITITLVFLITACVFLSNLVLRQHQQISLIKEQSTGLEKAISELATCQPSLINADLHISRKLREVNAQLVSMDNQLQNLENKRDNDGGYQHALRILEMGGSREEIVESCHLSSAEADLLMNLQAYRSAMKPSS